MKRLMWLLGWTLIWSAIMTILFVATMALFGMFFDGPLVSASGLLAGLSSLAFIAGIRIVSLSE